jgi:hypothetical protein
MERSKIVAIVTGAISLLLALGYLLLVQLLDFRGDMVPAPVSISPVPPSADELVYLSAITDQEDERSAATRAMFAPAQATASFTE